MKDSLFTTPTTRPSTPSHHPPNPVPPPPGRTNFSEAVIDENLDYAESIIRHCDYDTHFSSLFVGDRKEAREFLEAVATLQRAMHYYVKLNPNSEKLVKAKNLMPVAIKRLEKEFYVILSSNRKNLDSESVSSRSSTRSTDEDEDGAMTPRTPTRGGSPTSEAERASDTDMAMMDLKSIAECMIASGYGKECVVIYRLIRKSIVDETLYYLGVEKLSLSKMQKLDWKVLEAKLKSWVRAVRTAVKTLFHSERILCDVVFSSSERIAESCFAEISRDAAVNLFRFAENFGRSKKVLSPEKLFRALDMYEAIADLWPEIESIFSHESLAEVRSGAAAALAKLGEAVRVMLAQFEAAIQKDASKSTAGGGVHPLTRYVMNFLVFLTDYSGAVADIVTDWPLNGGTPLPESYFSSPTAGVDPSADSITGRLAWLILVLLCKLDGKAVQCNDVALSYLFLANNLNYVVSKVRNSNLGLLIGVDWIWNHRSKVNKYLENYERMGWSGVISSLPEDPTAEIPAAEAEECFRRFNRSFGETHKKQSSWVIPDPKLRDDVKVSLAKKLVPGYRVFYEKHRGKYARELGADAIVKYAPEDLNNYLSDLFFAAAGSGGSTTTSHGTYAMSAGGGR